MIVFSFGEKIGIVEELALIRVVAVVFTKVDDGRAGFAVAENVAFDEKCVVARDSVAKYGLTVANFSDDGIYEAAGEFVKNGEFGCV